MKKSILTGLVAGVACFVGHKMGMGMWPMVAMVAVTTGIYCHLACQSCSK